MVPTTASIARRRLVNQRLVPPALNSAVDVVRALGAVQSQDYPNAKWAIARRTAGLTDADVERAIASGAILRTHVLRPTWHFVLPEDARWMLALTASRISTVMGYYNKTLGLDAAVFRRSHAALERALRDGAHRTRADLAAVLKRARVDVSTGQRVARLLLQAELNAVIISGPRRGTQFTYAAFDARVPPATPRDRDDALGELTRRYFATRGPATLQDFAWWSGLTVADARRGVDANGAALERETIDGRTYWHAAAEHPARRPRPSAQLLPNYDELFVGFRDRSAFAERIRTGPADPTVNALMGHMLFIDGQIVGGWRRAASGRAGVELRMFSRLSSAERALVAREVRRFGKFLGPGGARER